MIVVNKTDQKETADLKDFYEIKGHINTYYSGLVFDWRKDHGIIIGPKEYIKSINKINITTYQFPPTPSPGAAQELLIQQALMISH